MVATLESRVRQTDVPLFPPTSRWKQGHICGGERLDSVVENREEIVITRAGHDPVVIVSLADFESLRETAYLMRSPANARRLLDAMERLEAGRGEPHDLVDAD